jgi:hypothetical protein
MARIVPSEWFRRELDEAVAGLDGDIDPVETIARLGARLILQQVLEEPAEGVLCAWGADARGPEGAARDSGCSSALGRATTTGLTSPATSSAAACAARRSWSPTALPESERR